MDLFHGAEFLEDEHIRELSMFLRNLLHINLSGCYKLTDISFFALIMNCPLLNEDNNGGNIP
ncbi:putative leucine-rich repeat domain, L domain-containing protein [Lupinus albus]|uniref:Putative leucine-rich repeat domain, L domain-containing protein n=1 Tax=Lupinus albus TaxID=3870 RepID=A0A6A4NAK2_LUPAL|nr:putative leucine-rich repeat domain, L domain-containing protein [Lupinus albus]